ncbi:hypothetical protein CHS0354_039056 [Potamilus streckersoni]|uniref:C-type lectin domain-containing protein n=1 Tax=Potamilus streckersoni TaxID=2493646 RepID=A0AAE0RRE0_9BIVA|nr:hypothetical protein CHS0354_039056 [Potamilus streckersoni]
MMRGNSRHLCIWVTIKDAEQVKLMQDRLSSIGAALETINGRLGILLTEQNGLQALITNGFQMMNKTLAEIKKCLNCTQLKCPDGYLNETKFGPFCYRLESNRCKSWSRARQTCQNEGGDLVIPDVNTYQFFRNLAKNSKGQCQHFWIGGYTSTPGSNYVTVSGVSIPITFPFWSVGQPDGLGGENCLEMRSYFTNYLMNDYHCNVPHGFICQKLP